LIGGCISEVSALSSVDCALARKQVQHTKTDWVIRSIDNSADWIAVFGLG
jgi:hypothetical protein